MGSRIGYSDSLVRFLGTADGFFVLARFGVILTKLFCYLGSDLRLSLGAEVVAVGTHVGDVPVFVQRLGGPHSASGRKAKPTRGILLH